MSTITFHLYHVTTFLQPGWYSLYVPLGQGSVTLLTRPFLVGARRGAWGSHYYVPCTSSCDGNQEI